MRPPKLLRTISRVLLTCQGVGFALGHRFSLADLAAHFRGYFVPVLSKLVLSYFAASMATTCGVRIYLGKNGMCDLIVRRGPEGQRLNVSPARKGWGYGGRMIRAP
jgi:hypothetical protein